MLQVSSGAEKGGGKSLHELLGRIVGAERSRELEGDVPSGLGASRQVPQHGLSLLDPVLGVAHAQNGLSAGLVPSRIEQEAAGILGGILYADSPSPVLATVQPVRTRARAAMSAWR